MKFTIVLLTFWLLFSMRLSAQNAYSIKGAVGDTASKATLVNTVVSVLNAKDSTLVKFTRAGKDGSFAIANLHKGKFILLVTYPEYADYVEPFSLDSTKTTNDFGRINMLLKAKLLADVIIKGTRAAIKIKGDTTEFNASAFTVQPNAKVEDLLKELPGIQVDKDGKITAQGQTVSKVLVDGEEFFGDDPTLVTKNIRADMVDKVQLYDKKSDQAAFTGIDDGQKTKTINIKLKEDSKNGYFGQLTLGDGVGDYYQGQLLFNMFKAKEKFSVYSTVGNNGKTGLGWQDSQKYGSGDGIQFGDDGNTSFYISNSGDGLDSFDGQYSGQGLPIAITGGVHYDSKWNSDKESVNANYKVGSLQVNGTSNTQTQSDFTGGLNFTNANENMNDFMFRQKLDVTYQVKPDTSSNIKFMVDGTLKNTHTVNSYYTTTRDSSNNLLNENTRNMDNRDNTQLYDASIFYTKKFHKKGRTLSFLVSESSSQVSSHGYLDSKIIYYQDTAVNKPQYINQYKTSEVNSNNLKTNLTYTEPLSKDLSVVVNYGFGINDGTSKLDSYNEISPGVYSTIGVDTLSDSYKLTQYSNQVGGIFNYKKGKLNLNVGTKVSNVSFDQVNEDGGASLKRDFINWNPQANLQYRFSQMAGIYFNYQGRTVQPSISQIQPVTINSDPLSVIVGNPNLTPSFTHSFYLNYNSYKVISGQSIFLYGNYSFTTNPIVSNMTTDTTTGKSTTKYLNLADKRQANYNVGVNYDKKIDKLGFSIGGYLGVDGNDSYNLSNDDVNYTKSITYTASLRFSRYKEKKYDFSFDLGPNYTLSGSSLQPTINNNGRGFTSDLYLNVYLPDKFQIGSNDNYQWRGKTETFNTDFNQTLVNADIARTFLKGDNLKVELWVNDLLNQNSGFNRTINANLITQNTYTTIKRYFMLSIIYDFSKMGGITK